MKKVILRGVLACLVVAPLTGCSSDESVIGPKETSDSIRIVLNTDMPQTRVVMNDGIDATPATFSATWEAGDLLVAYNVTKKKKTTLTASGAGKTVLFTGSFAASDISNGDKIALVSTNCTIDGNGVATMNIANQKGTLTYVAKNMLLYGSTTAAIDAANKMATLTCTMQQKLAIVRANCIFNNEDNATLSAFSFVDQSGTPFASQVVCDLSTGNLTNSAAVASKNYLRATFDQLQAPASEVHGGTTYYLNKVYLLMAPGTLPASLTINAFSLGKDVYKTDVNLGSATNLIAGDVQPVNINYCSSDTKVIPAISCPGFDFSLSPGIVVAYRNSTSDAWSYRFSNGQNDLANLDKQSDTFGCYFTWGSVNPMDVYYITATNSKHAAVSYDATTFQDVASLCGNGWRMPTKDEAQSIMDMLKSTNSCEGTYNAGGIDVRGRYVGTTAQPTIADQDRYFFFPYAGDLHNSSYSDNYKFTVNGNTFYYGTPAAYAVGSTGGNISIWTSTPDTDNKAYRLQYNPASPSTSDVSSRVGTFGRVIRGVRY